MLKKYDFRPGIVREGTSYSEEGGFFNADKVRFRSGRPEKIGGWEKNTLNSFEGTCRSLHSYRDQGQTDYIGVGTHLKLYVKQGDNFNNITPIRKTSTNSITFAATNGSSTVVVTDSSHGAVTGDTVTFSQAVSLGGNITAAVLNQEYTIDKSLTANTYEITAKDTSGSTVTANSSDESGTGGSGVDGSYEINIGLDTFVKGTGWGVDTWGASTWGSVSSLSANNQLRLWSQDNFGDDLITCVRGGGIFLWDESAGTSQRAVAFSDLSGASAPPVKALQIMVSDIDRHIICFGANPIGSTDIDPLFVRWSDQESSVDWTPTSTNTAGGTRLSSGSTIIGALRTRQEILIWTDNGLHSMQYSGAPFIFSFAEIMQGPSMISPNAAINADNKVFFMDRGSFYVYSGSVQTLPCAVQDYIFADINLGQSFKVFGLSNVDHNEIMWFYPSADSDELDRYVIFNYLENTWSIGTTDNDFVRTAWIEANSLDFPVAAGKTTNSNTNYLYNHEVGNDADGTAMTAFIETSDFDLEPDGEHFMFVSKIIPDLKFRGQTGTANTLNVSVKGVDFPLDTPTTLSTSAIDSTTQQAFIRARTRQAILRFESTGLGYGWRLGSFRLEMRQDGKK
mgnify:FL=1